MKFKKLFTLIMGIITAAGLSVSAGSAAAETGVVTESVTRRALSAGDTYSKGGLLYTELDDGTYEVGYDYELYKPDSHVTIPEKVNGKTVTRIAESGFYRCHELESISLPKTVVSAGENAFTGTKLVADQSENTIRYAGHLAVECSTSATEAEIKEGTLGLSDKLFALSPNIEEVDLPTSLVNLGSNTFAGCDNLSYVWVPDGVTEIKDGVFYGCKSLNPHLPKKLKSIGAYAFANSGIKNANMPNVTKIGKGAFEDSKLAGAVVGDGFIEIGGRAFAGTPYYDDLGREKYIGKICIGAASNAKNVTVSDGTLGIADMAFTECDYLESVTIPGSVKEIGEDAFFNCSKLTSVKIGEGVESISEDAFRLCSRLSSLSLPTSLKAVYEGAFYGCSKLGTVSYAGSITDWAKIAFGDDNDAIFDASIECAKEPKSLEQVGKLTVTKASYDRVSFSWTESRGALVYEIHQRNGISWKKLDELSGDSKSYTVDGLSPNTEYTFRVTAKTGSLKTTATVTARTTIEPMYNLKATVCEDAVLLSWDKNADAELYIVEKRTGESEWQEAFRTTKNTVLSCTINDLLPLTEYSFRVVGVSGDQRSDASEVKATTAESIPLDPVSSLKAAPGINNIKLSWGKSANADRYQVEIMRDGKWRVLSSSVTSTSYNVTGLDGLTEYKFRVFAFRGTKYSKSQTITATTLTDVPDPVSSLTAAPGINNIKLSWGKSAIADRYQVEIMRDGKWRVLSSSVTSTTYNVTELDALTEYKFRVFAFRGAKYSKSQTVTATTLTDVPDPVSSLTAAPGINNIKLSWGKSAIADRYQVEIMRDGKWRALSSSVTSTTYNVTGLDGLTEYKFRVFAFRGAKYSKSQTITATTLTDVPDPVSSLKATPGAFNVKLTWGKSAIADRYQVEIMRDGKWRALSSSVTSTTYNVTELDALTEYKFRVFAFRGTKYSGSQSVITTTLAYVPDPVSNLTAESGINNIKLSWGKSANADRYQVEIMRDGKWRVLSSSVTSTSYNVTELDALTEYKFRVFAFCKSNYSRSQSVTATTLTDVPGPVSSLTAAPGINNIKLSWGKSAIADRYQVEIMRDGKWRVLSSSVTTTSYNVIGLDGLTEYKFRVFAFRGTKYSRSQSVTATTLTDVPDPVSSLTAAPGINNIMLSWGKSAIADRYQVEIMRDGKWRVLSSSVTSTTYNVTGLDALTEYKFRVFAFRGTKYSRSQSVTATTLTDVPDPVSSLTAAPGINNIMLSWGKSAIADRYQVEIMRDGKWRVLSSSVTSTSYNVTGLDALTEYKFRVFAFRGTKYSKSQTITATTLTDVPGPVSSLTAAPGINNIMLSWGKSANADRYQVEIMRDGKWRVLSSSVTSTSYNVTGLDGLTEYKFRVFAFRGTKYSRSQSVTATTLNDVPDPVRNITAKNIDTTKFTLSWSKSAIADKYRIEMKSNGTWKSLAETTSLSYSVTSLLPNTEYNFRVKALRGSKASTATEFAMKTASKCPAPVQGLEAIAKPGSVKLLWEKSLLADSYRVEMLQNDVWVSIAKTTATSYNVTGLSEGTSYEFRVRAMNYVEYSTGVRISTVTKKSLTPILDLSLQFGDSRMMMKGIDVSGYQGDIDFNAVKKSGVDFVIIKAGYSTSTVDTWETNYKKAKRAGLKVGAYWFSYATTLSQGRSEAKAFIRAMDGKQLDFPVYFDIETSDQFGKGMTFCTNLVETFCSEVEDAGYLAGVYCSRYWYTNYVSEDVRLSRPTWIADYARACDYGGSYGIWQYGTGWVDGITESKTDLNWAYTDYSSFIKRNGLNGY